MSRNSIDLCIPRGHKQLKYTSQAIVDMIILFLEKGRVLRQLLTETSLLPSSDT